MLLTAFIFGAGMSAVAASQTDSLRASLSVAKGIDRIRIYEKIYILSLDTDDIDYQLRCVNDLIAETRRQKDAPEEADALGQRAVLFYNYAMDDSVIAVVPKDKERLKELGQWRIYYEMWGRLASTYVFKGQNKLGLQETSAMFKDAKERGDTLGMGQANCIMGTAYANLRNFDQSVEVFEKSLEELSEMKPMPFILPDVYTYYGDALNDMKDYAKLEQLTQRWHDFLPTFIRENHLEDNATGDIYWAYYYLACTQAALGLGKLADASLHLADARRHIINMENELGGKWLYLAAQLGYMEGRYADALAFNDHRLRQVEQLDDQSMRVVVCHQRAEIFEKMGRIEDAARYYKEIYILNDSLNAQETKSQLNEMNTIFQVSEKQMENERLQMKSARAQLYFVIVVVSLIVLSLAIFLFFRIRAARRLKQAHTELQTAYSDLQAANEVIEQTTAAKERIESELRIASDIQMSMVPTIFPERPGLDLYASMTPAKEVGGDMYSYLLIEDTNKLYFALGDVSGKGVPASLFMAQATRLFHTLAKQQLPPAEIGTRMNDELAEDNEQGMFITLFIGLIDLNTGHLDFCNGGHNPPVLLEKTTPENDKYDHSHFLDMIPNAPIGLWPGLEYEGEEIDDIRGKPLFIYTDGLNEAENRQQEQFTDERLLEILEATPFESAQQTVELLKAKVELHRDGADPNDDLTMMCVFKN